jgi:hypothetical protein
MRFVALGLACLLCASLASPARAADAKAFNLALFNPVQIYDETTPINGVRLNLIYGKNAAFSGLDVGIVNEVQGGFTGLQYGLVGIVRGEFLGWQDNGIANYVDRQARGLQWGVFNYAETMIGVQVGLVNVSHDMNGVALALVNSTENLRGLQIGIVNIASNLKGHPVLPIVNFSF